MTPLRLLVFASTALASFALVACRPQTDTTYAGDPIVTLHGTVVLDGPAPDVPVEAALVWTRLHVNGPDGGHYLNTPNAVATKAVVSGSFPASFTMDVLTPPPAEVLSPCNPNDPAGAHFAAAEVAVIGQSADPANLTSSDFYGSASGVVVYYFDADLGSDGCFMVSEIGPDNLPPAKGYHLYAPPPPPPAAILAGEVAALEACEADGGSRDSCESVFGDAGTPFVPFSTPITVTIAPPPSTSTFTTSGAFLDGGSDAGALCLPQPLSADGGEPPCVILIGLTTGTCFGLGADVTSQAVGQNYQESAAAGGVYYPAVCELAYVPSADWSDGSCVGVSSPGWCYVTGRSAAPCAQSILFTEATVAPPDPNARVSLSCTEPLTP